MYTRSRTENTESPINANLMSVKWTSENPDYLFAVGKVAYMQSIQWVNLLIIVFNTLFPGVICYIHCIGISIYTRESLHIVAW